MADLNKPGPSKPAKDSKKYDEDGSYLICNLVLNTEDLVSVNQHYHDHLNKSIKQLNTNNENLKQVEEERNKLMAKEKLVQEEREKIKRHRQLAMEALWRVQENDVAEGA